MSKNLVNVNVVTYDVIIMNNSFTNNYECESYKL